MVLETLAIRNIRNHSISEFRFPENGILFWGDNGAGKTAVLESISLLCTSKSFVTSLDKSVVNRDAERCVVEGTLKSESGSMHSVALKIPHGQGRKQITLDHSTIPSSVDLIGRFPVVSLSPQYRSITNGGPAERRAFIDFVISQAHHSYLMDLVEYRKIVKQRNALLADQDICRQKLQSLLAPWNEQFAVVAARIIRQRAQFIGEFIPVFCDAYRSIVPDGEEPMLRYASSAEVDPHSSALAEELLRLIEQAFENDYRRRVTTRGPHRDDLEILLNGMDVREHASQGQHKSLLIALKLGEYHYLEQRLDERPLLLLDDVFSELDNTRLTQILNLVGTLGQTFITSANESVARYFPERWRNTLTVRIEKGSVVEFAS